MHLDIFLSVLAYLIRLLFHLANLYDSELLLPLLRVNYLGLKSKILEVSLDWLVGNTDVELNTARLNRIQDINKLSPKDNELVYEFLDSLIANRKIKNVLQ
jgi:hypothetical protein